MESYVDIWASWILALSVDLGKERHVVCVGIGVGVVLLCEPIVWKK